MTTALVSSWNDWDPLEEVVVGDPTGACYDVTEPGHRPKRRGPRRDLPFPKPADAIARARAELDGLAALLQGSGRQPKSDAGHRRLRFDHSSSQSGQPDIRSA